MGRAHSKAMKSKKLASEKPVEMSDELWKIFMAHKGDQAEMSGLPTLGLDGKVVYLNNVNLAEVADFFQVTRARKSFRAEDYLRDREERTRRGKEGD